MSSKNSGKVRAEIIKYIETKIKKSDCPENINVSENAGYSEWIPQPVPLKGFEVMAENSSILPQCINAYKSNIAGFGIAVRYKEDVTDTQGLEDEFNRLSDIVELLNTECDTKEIFEKIIAARETYGIAYLEVIRNGLNEVDQIEFIENVPSIEKSSLQFERLVEAEYRFNDRIIKRKKKFCRYKQTVNGKTVYFKEFGDMRIMDKETGKICFRA